MGPWDPSVGGGTVTHNEVAPRAAPTTKRSNNNTHKTQTLPLFQGSGAVASENAKRELSRGKERKIAEAFLDPG